MKDIDIHKLQELESKIQTNISKEINNILEKTVRENSFPQIKGEITKGKLKWRGIKLCQRNSICRTEYWIEQRGIVIGKSIVIIFSMLYNGKNI